MKKDSRRSTPNWSAIGRRSFISMAAALGVGMLTGPVLAQTKTDPTASNEGKPLAVREFQIKGGGFVISELLEYNESEMWFTYRIIKTDLLLKNYVGDMRVKDNAKGECIVHWEGEFEHPKGSAATAKENDQTFGLVQAVFQGGFENIERLATA